MKILVNKENIYIINLWKDINILNLEPKKYIKKFYFDKINNFYDYFYEAKEQTFVVKNNLYFKSVLKNTKKGYRKEFTNKREFMEFINKINYNIKNKDLFRNRDIYPTK